MKRILSFVLCLVGCTLLWANRASFMPFPLTLADGRVVTAMVHGDERFSYVTTTDGQLLRCASDQSWHVATAAERQALIDEQQAVLTLMRTAPVIKASRPFPHTGKPHILTIMVSFTDQAFTYTAEDFQQWLNSTEVNVDANNAENYGSVAGFFDACSDGQFRPQFDVVGPYALPNATAYYGEGQNDRMDRLIPAACAAADSAGVDFSQYDADGDGYVDLVAILYAGYSASSSPETWLLWPKSGYGNYGTYDGKQVYRYCINNEILGHPGIEAEQKWPMPKIAGVGVFCHELCHTLGLPDLYPTLQLGSLEKYDNQSMEVFSLMDWGENNVNGMRPTPLNAFECEWLGWTTPIDTLSTPGQYTLKPRAQGGKAMMILNPAHPTQDEYYILECLPQEKIGWYRDFPANGLLITHIEYDIDAFSNFSGPNNTAGHPRCTPISASGSLMSSERVYYGTALSTVRKQWATVTYPGANEVKKVEAYYNYTGDEMVDTQPITDITLNADGSVSFTYGKNPSSLDSATPDQCGIDTLPYCGQAYDLYGRPCQATHGPIIMNRKAVIIEQ